MKTKFSFAVLLCSMFMSLILTSCDEDEVGSISGNVTSSATGEVIAGANVKLSPLGHSMTTRNDGTFFFKDIEARTYDLSVVADGYESYNQTVTVLKDQTITADIQLTLSAKAISINPLTLTFGPSISQMTFSIKNNTSSNLTYSISSYESFLNVVPATATVAAKGTQTVTVSVDRTKVTSTVSTNLIINVGNDSYPLTITVNAAN